MIIDAKISLPPSTVEAINDWLERLAHALAMKVLSGPHSCICTEVGNEGVTGFVVLSTSHCSIHVWNKAEVPFARIDVYSCIPFEVAKVVKLINEFRPSSYEYIVIDRNEYGPVTVGRDRKNSYQ